ncbi:MAG: AAA family ATPase [Candidatus Paceibacterota bacterium]
MKEKFPKREIRGIKYSTIIEDIRTLLIYGAPGTGKTYFIATMPQPIFVFDIDDGLRTIRTRMRKEKFKLAYDYETYDFGDKHTPEKMAAKFDEVKEEKKYATIVLDTASKLNRAIMAQVLDLKTEGGSSTAKNVGGAPGKLHYGIQIFMFERFISHFMSYPGFVLVNSHAAIQKNKIDMIEEVMPAITGGASNRLSDSFDEYYHSFYDSVGKRYRANARPDGIYQARSRGGLPDVVGLDFGEIIDYIYNDINPWE